MDFAGSGKDPAVRQALAALRNGDVLVVEPLPGQRRCAFRTIAGRMVGRTAEKYSLPAGRIVTARVSSICVRRLQDVKAEKWRERMVVAEWEVVLPELMVEPEG